MCQRPVELTKVQHAGQWYTMQSSDKIPTVLWNILLIIQEQGENRIMSYPGAARHRHFGYLQRSLRGIFLGVHIQLVHPVVSVHYESERSVFIIREWIQGSLQK